MQPRYPVLYTSLCLFTACANLAGGQSGDDGDVIDPGGEPTLDPDPGPGEVDDDCTEGREVDAASPTSLGKTPSELIAELEPMPVPLHWVPFDSERFNVTFDPGPSETHLTLTFALRSGLQEVSGEETILERLPKSQAIMNDECGGARVEAPVWVGLSSEDGALNERLAGKLVLYGNAVAEVFATVSIEELGGSFRFDTPSERSNGELWKPSTLTLNAQLWPGGSAGAIYPEFVPAASLEGGSGDATSPPPAALPSDEQPHPEVPQRWNAVAVWPRLEQCSLGVARTPLDAVLGVSAQNVIETLATRMPHTLSVTKNETALSSTLLTFDLVLSQLPNLLCIAVDHRRRQLSFALPASLRGEGDGSAPAQVDVSFDLSLSARTNSRDLTVVHFSRTLDETSYPISRTALTEMTGLVVEGLDADYSEFWWTWYGSLAPEMPTESAAYDAHLVVAAPSSRERAAVEEQTANGGPGFNVSYDNESVQLPGDVVFHAEAAE